MVNGDYELEGPFGHLLYILLQYTAWWCVYVLRPDPPEMHKALHNFLDSSVILQSTVFTLLT